MKKFDVGLQSHWLCRFRKIFMIMRITAVLMLLTFMQVSASVYSQSIKLSVELHKGTLGELFEKIEKDSDFEFFYHESRVDVNKNIDIKMNKRTVNEILDKVFEDTGLTYQIIDRHIIITSKNSKEEVKQSQPQSISGNVTDLYGEPLPGVSVVVKGTTVGVVTDLDGNYQLEVPADYTVVVFSFMGMKTQEVELSGQSTINIKMEESTVGLEEVVAIGYGVQKKVNLTGSVAAVDNEQLENRPVTQLSQALTGQVSGVTIIQRSGEPGSDAGTIRIRGEGTFSGAGRNPLVLVDGLEGSLNTVDPNDIESISVLKDAASAAIYGSRAANGVILITTKKGKEGKLIVKYSGYAGWQEATEFPDYLNSSEYAELYNEALTNDGQQPMYTSEEIQKFKDGSDPDYYPNTDFLGEIFKSSALQTGHNISLNGGSAANRYNLSVGYLDQDGLAYENNYKRYNFRLNLNSNISEDLDLAFNISGYRSEQNEPVPAGGTGSGSEVTSLVSHAVRMPPVIAGRKSDGSYGFMNEGAPLAWLDSESFKENNIHHFLGSANLGWQLTPELKVSGMAGYKFHDVNRTTFNPQVQLDVSTTQGPAKVENYMLDAKTLTLQSLVNYDKRIEDHEIHLLGGFSRETYRQDWTKASRDNFANNELHEINGGSEENMKASGSAEEWALQSVFGRVGYSYKGKYLFEANARYDGSSRFSDDERYGFFPSFSGAWRVSEESFIKDNASWIDNLKLRASWGELGNQNIGSNYPYQSVIALGQNYSFGDALAPGAAVNTLPNKSITWETTQVLDFGFDATIYGGLLNVTADYFRKKTLDILYKISSSKVLGLTPSEVNAGEVLNKGFEVNVTHKHRVGELRYNVGVNFSYIHNEVLELANVEKDIAKGLFVGEPLNSYYGYVADGLFVDQADVESYASQPYNAEPGDIRYKDISGPDGTPDGVVDPNYDRKVIGSRIPKYTYGANLSASFRNFDFSVQLQGVAGVDGMLSGYAGAAFYHKGKAQRWHLQRWTKENPDRNAPHPRVQVLSNSGEPNLYTSTFWATDASYLRVKNLQVGYNIPKSILDDFRINKMRIYFSGQNLFTFDDYYKGWDPEQNVSGGFYPLTAVYTFGVNVTF
ncbi:SusC/RagA family TonB-linked outer membrane protein [Puteibacter caeruleilacunae]|nr:SusC/RagA family TonB-linked outer membrane protein [Puteibacter caeruleilacunae]